MHQIDEASAVRGLPEARVFLFPAGAIVRRRGVAALRPEQVAVTHQGETVVYESAEALYAVLRAADPQLLALNAEAADLRRQAVRRHAQAETLLNRVGLGGLVALLLVGVLLVAAL